MWPWLERIEASAPATFVRESVWAYPLLEIVHIAAFATLFGSLLLLELRVFGAGAELALRPLARLAVRTALIAFVIAATSGLLLLASDAVRLSTNIALLFKLTMIVLAGINAVIFHRRHSLQRHDGVARVQAALSLALWLAVIGAGRMIAYV